MRTIILYLVGLTLLIGSNCAHFRPAVLKEDQLIREKYSQIKTIVDAVYVIDKKYVEKPDWYKINIDTVSRVREKGVNYLEIRVSDNITAVGCRDYFKYYDRLSMDGEGKYEFADTIYRFYLDCDPTGNGKRKGSFDELYLSSLLDSLKRSSYLNASFFELIEQEKKKVFGSIGVELRKAGRKIIVVSTNHGSPAERAGILANDIVTKIGKESTAEMPIWDAVKRMRGEVGTEVTLFILRNGQNEPEEITLKRDIVRIESVTRKELGEGIVYVKLRSFQQYTATELDKALRAQDGSSSGLKGLVLDLRDNPGGLLDQAIKVTEMFLDSGLIVSIYGRDGRNKENFFAGKEGRYTGFPIVVLVNQDTAAGSEIVAGALQDHGRAVIIGAQTFGNSFIQSILPLPDGTGLRLTTAYFYLRDGRSIQDNGIVPDVLVAEQGDTDEVLESGLNVLRLPSFNRIVP